MFRIPMFRIPTSLTRTSPDGHYRCGCSRTWLWKPAAAISNPDVFRPSVSNPDIADPDVTIRMSLIRTLLMGSSRTSHGSSRTKRSTRLIPLQPSSPTASRRASSATDYQQTLHNGGQQLRARYADHHEILTNIVNPVFSSPSSAANPNVSRSAINDPTLTSARIRRRTPHVVHRNKNTNTNFNLSTAVIAAATSHAINLADFWREATSRQLAPHNSW